MSDNQRFEYHEPQWCPGCGNFDILACVKESLLALNLTHRDFILVTGIGQASKLGFSVKVNLFDGLHGRALPAALGINLANHKVKLLSVSGDGDFFSEGGNHFIHAARRNLNIAVFAGDNRVFGLTKGQAAPTAAPDFVTKTHPEGVGGTPLNPVLLALVSGATFVARAFSGNKQELSGLIQQAVQHRGFAFIDILSPCITFNKINNFGWYKKKAVPLPADRDVSNLPAAVLLAMQDEKEGIPTGLFYKVDHPVFSDRFSALKGESLAARAAALTPERVRGLFEQYR